MHAPCDLFPEWEPQHPVRAWLYLGQPFCTLPQRRLPSFHRLQWADPKQHLLRGLRRYFRCRTARAASRMPRCLQAGAKSYSSRSGSRSGTSAIRSRSTDVESLFVRRTPYGIRPSTRPRAARSGCAAPPATPRGRPRSGRYRVTTPACCSCVLGCESPDWCNQPRSLKVPRPKKRTTVRQGWGQSHWGSMARPSNSSRLPANRSRRVFVSKLLPNRFGCEGM